jgi:hypothetical protein
MPSEEELPPTVQPIVWLNAADVRSDRHFGGDLDLLIRGLRTYIHDSE